MTQFPKTPLEAIVPTPRHTEKAGTENLHERYSSGAVRDPNYAQRPIIVGVITGRGFRLRNEVPGVTCAVVRGGGVEGAVTVTN